MSGRIAVGVSGTGSNLRALVAAAGRGALGGEVVLVFADRACPGLDWAAEQGIDTVLVPGGDDAILAETLSAVEPDVVVLAGYLRLVGPAVLAAFGGRILNVHPSLLPSFPGLHGARDALAAGVAVTGVTVHLVDATLDGGPIVAQEAVPVLPGDTEDTLLARIHPVEHRLLPAAVAALLAGALRVGDGGRRATLDTAAADAAMPVPRRALLSVSDKTGLADLGRGLVARGWELVSTGGTARALREAGLPVTDVAAVTGFPEMLDGRVKTLHPRVHGGLLADRRRADHREALLAAGIAPFDLVVVNLYPFAEAARRPGLSFDDLVEEIDIGGPSMVRAAAKNHASVAIVTSPARYGAVLAALDEHGSIPLGLRSALAVEAFRHTAAYDARIAAELPGRMVAAGVELPAEPGLPGADDPYPPVLTISMDKVDTLRYGENPHQPAARYRRTDREPRADRRPVRERGAAAPGQGAVLQQRARRLCRRRARPADARSRDRHLQAHQPVWRRGASDPARGLGGGAGRRPGLGVRGRGRRHRDRGPGPGRAAGVDLPRGRGRAGVRRGQRSRCWRPSPTCAWSWTPRWGPARWPRPPIRSAPSGPRAVASSSPRPTASRTIRPPGRARRHAGPPMPSSGTWTSPGASAGVSSRTRSCSSATGCSWAWAPAR